MTNREARYQEALKKAREAHDALAAYNEAHPLPDTSTVTVEVRGDQPVIINKLYGPLIFANLRITADTKTGNWIIEREWIKTGEYSSSFHVIIPGQIAEEFTQDDEE